MLRDLTQNGTGKYPLPIWNMNSKRTLAVTLALAALAVSSGAYADETSTGSVVGTGSTASGATSTGAPAPRYHTGAAMREMREMRGAVKQARQEVRTETKSGCDTLKAQNSELRDSVKMNWNVFHTQFGNVKTYFKTGMTIEEKTAISKIWTDHVRSRQTIVSGTGTDSEKLAALKTALTTALDAFKPYVAADKADAYAKFTAERIATLEKNLSARAAMETNRAQCKLLRETAKTNITNKVTAITDAYVAKFVTAVRTGMPNVPAERQAKAYAEIVKKIDALLAKPLSETSKVALTQLRADVQAKIDALPKATN